MTSALSAMTRRVAGGALLIGVGLTATGIGTLVMMSLSARSLPAPEYAALAVWWTLATLIGTGFGVFENYLARVLVADVAARRRTGPVTGFLLGRFAWSALIISVILFALAPLTAPGLLDGSLGLALLLPAYVTLAGAQAFQRGAATGHGRYAAVAAQLVVDGLLRAVFSVALVATDHESVVALGLGACAAAATGLVVGGSLCPAWLAIPRLREGAVDTRPLLLLLLASSGPLLANNGPVPWLAATHSVSAYTVGAFAGAVTLSRLPTQFIAAAFAPLFSQLAGCVETGDEQTYQRLQRRALLLACAAALVFVAGFAVTGPWLLRAYLGPGYGLSHSVLGVLAAGSGLMFVAFVRQAGLMALHRWSVVAQAWLAGTVVFACVLLLTPLSTLIRATAAPTAAVLTALAVMSLRRVRWHPTAA